MMAQTMESRTYKSAKNMGEDRVEVAARFRDQLTSVYGSYSVEDEENRCSEAEKLG